MNRMTRRAAARLIGGAAIGSLVPMKASRGQGTRESLDVVARAIPVSGEKLPVIGLGTWRAFDVDPAADTRRQLQEVLSLFVKLGGRVVDTSPMYGRAEEVIGDLISTLGIRDALFLATKVWTRGRQNGISSMARSLELLRTKRIDLMQVHNLVDVKTHLATLRDWQREGRIRYVGITHYESGAFEEMENLIRSEKLDFIQINYSLLEPEAAERVLPLARDRGIAVLVNRPFGAGDLFDKVRSKPVPDWASEFEARSWAQFFLKWVVANPAVTCAIPATSKPAHLQDNMRGGVGRLPDASMRRRMLEFLASL